MKKLMVVLALAAAGFPVAALAKSPHSSSSTMTGTTANGTGQSVKVLFVIRGVETGYTAAAGTTNGSVALTFKSSNFSSTTLKAASQPLTFVVTQATDHVGRTLATGNSLIVKLRAAKNASLATIEAAAATEIVNQTH